MDRTEADRASGILRLRIGGEERIVPTLPIRPARDWRRRVLALSGGFGLPPLETWAADAPGRFADLTEDAILDLVVEYDREGTLGGRAWLEEHADPTELYGALQAMIGNALPFAGDGRTLLTTLVVLAAADPSAPGSSTNGRSRRGTLRPASSRSSSTRSSS